MGDHKEQPLRVGAAVRRRRRALELTLAVVAARSGLSVPFLSQIENDRARPSTNSLEKVADALRTTAVELLAPRPTRRAAWTSSAPTAPSPSLSPGRVPWSAATIRCMPPSSPATMTRVVNSSIATTS